MRAELGATLRLAAPLAAANLLQMAVYAIDVMFVARLGQEALAASSLAVAVFGLLVWCLTGLTGAVAPLMAAELGRRANAVREVRRSIRMALWASAITGLMGMALCLSGRELILLTGQDPRIAGRAGGFLAILSFAMIPMIAASVLHVFVSALGRPGYATAITALSIAVNALGNYAFIFGHFGMPALGLDGSALSTIVTSLAMCAAYVLVIRADRRLRRFHPLGRLWRPDWERLRDILRIGTPVALIVAAEGGLFGSAAFLMGRIGEPQLAGHAVALQIAAFAFQVPMGIAQAATIRVGLHFGAGDRDGIARAGMAAFGAGIAFMAIPALLMLVAPRLLLSVYVDPRAPANAAMIGFALQYLVIAAAFQLFDGTQAVAAGVLRGLQDTRTPMLLALFGYWLPGFGTCVWLGFFTPLAGTGIWIGLAAGLVVVAVLLVHRWTRRETLGLLPAPIPAAT